MRLGSIPRAEENGRTSPHLWAEYCSPPCLEFHFSFQPTHCPRILSKSYLITRKPTDLCVKRNGKNGMASMEARGWECLAYRIVHSPKHWEIRILKRMDIQTIMELCLLFIFFILQSGQARSDGTLKPGWPLANAVVHQ